MSPGRIGILALQGGFAAHGARIEELGHDAVYVRGPADLEKLDGLVLPGGESSVQLLLLEKTELAAPLTAFVASGLPVLATCAGLILAAREVSSPEQASLGFIDVSVTRNAYGRQKDSFEATDDRGELPLIFIRAPRITRVGPSVDVLATLGGEPILVRQKNVTAATFHPELTTDPRIHREVFGRAERAAGRAAVSQSR